MKIRFLIVCLVSSQLLCAQDFFKYKISKPYCVLNFMNTATGSGGTSSTLKKFIEEKTLGDTDFQKLCEDFQAITLHYNIDRQGLPQTRIQNNSTYNLLAMNAVNAENLQDFKLKSLGLLPLSDNQKLFEVLVKAEKTYDRIIWNVYRKSLEKQRMALARFTQFNTQAFTAFAAFYQSAWTNDIPFQVAIYPIPGKSGSTSATPHINNLCVGVLTDDTDYEGTNGVVLHEMCHIMFNEQRATVQNQLDAYFNENKSPYAKIAYSFFDEALATALGNGWAYKKSTGKEDSGSWYNNATIDGFAKALYPQVSNYLASKKGIDQEFIDTAIALFAAKFPKSIYEYDISLYGIVLYTDLEDNTNIKAELRKRFRVASFDVSSPILHPYSIESINNSKLTQFFVIDKNHSETLARLKEIFPEINSYQFTGKTQNLTFIDKAGRTVILLLLNDLGELQPQLQKIKDARYFDTAALIQNQ